MKDVKFNKLLAKRATSRKNRDLIHVFLGFCAM